jgi:hypothetical protein
MNLCRSLLSYRENKATDTENPFFLSSFETLLHINIKFMMFILFSNETGTTKQTMVWSEGQLSVLAGVTITVLCANCAFEITRFTSVILVLDSS